MFGVGVGGSYSIGDCGLPGTGQMSRSLSVLKIRTIALSSLHALGDYVWNHITVPAFQLVPIQIANVMQDHHGLSAVRTADGRLVAFENLAVYDVMLAFACFICLGFRVKSAAAPGRPNRNARGSCPEHLGLGGAKSPY